MEARQSRHFKYISFDWIGPPPKNKTGAYLLKATGGCVQGEPFETDFILYYYPDPNKLDFEYFSYLEQMVRMSDVFGRTGVLFASHCPIHCDYEDEGNDEHNAVGGFEDLKFEKGIPTPDARSRLCTSLFAIGQTP